MAHRATQYFLASAARRAGRKIRDARQALPPPRGKRLNLRAFEAAFVKMRRPSPTLDGIRKKFWPHGALTQESKSSPSL
jgi:hypothetical protein